jgi:ribonuclease-3
VINHEQRSDRARNASELGEMLGVAVTPELMTTALTHRSFSYENGGVPHNERLEFLGDAVLSIVVTDTLYRDFPDLPEGRLAKMRASVVQMRALADIARGIGPDGLGAYLRLGRGEETTGGRDKSSILADTLEAVLGAIYLDLGPDVAHRVVHGLFDQLIAAAALQGAALDWKTSLQELTAELGLGVPEYLIESEGPDHERRFTARAIVADEQFGACVGRNKKEAEQAAAAAAWTVLGARSGATDLPGTAYIAEPATTDPATADPATTESATTHPATADPATTDAALPPGSG